VALFASLRPNAVRGTPSVGLTGSTLRDIDGESRSQGSATAHGRRQMRLSWATKMPVKVGCFGQRRDVRPADPFAAPILASSALPYEKVVEVRAQRGRVHRPATMAATTR